MGHQLRQGGRARRLLSAEAQGIGESRQGDKGAAGPREAGVSSSEESQARSRHPRFRRLPCVRGCPREVGQGQGVETYCHIGAGGSLFAAGRCV